MGFLDNVKASVVSNDSNEKMIVAVCETMYDRMLESNYNCVKKNIQDKAANGDYVIDNDGNMIIIDVFPINGYSIHYAEASEEEKHIRQVLLSKYAENEREKGIYNYNGFILSAEYDSNYTLGFGGEFINDIISNKRQGMGIFRRGNEYYQKIKYSFTPIAEKFVYDLLSKMKNDNNNTGEICLVPLIGIWRSSLGGYEYLRESTTLEGWNIESFCSFWVECKVILHK